MHFLSKVLLINTFFLGVCVQTFEPRLEFRKH